MPLALTNQFESIDGLILSFPPGTRDVREATWHLQDAAAEWAMATKIPWLVTRAYSWQGWMPARLPGSPIRVWFTDFRESSLYEPGRTSQWSAWPHHVACWRGERDEAPDLGHALMHVCVIPNDQGHRDPRWVTEAVISSVIAAQLRSRP